MIMIHHVSVTPWFRGTYSALLHVTTIFAPPKDLNVRHLCHSYSGRIDNISNSSTARNFPPRYNTNAILFEAEVGEREIIVELHLHR